MKIIGITGGTGFIGHHLTRLLVEAGNQVVIFTRYPLKQHITTKVAYAYWDPIEGKCDLINLGRLDAVVHLAGAGIADKRWTKKRKKEIIGSRVHGTNFLISKLKEHAPSCKTIVAASAIGYYGPDRNGAVPFTEDAVPYDDFLANTCVQWENATQQAASFLRTVIFRFGIVLGKEDGVFPKLATPISLGMMPILGSGKQMTSWIHADDLCRMIINALKTETVNGIYNAVSPQPVTHKQLMKTIAQAKGGLRIPMPVPAFFLKILLGELSQEVLKSCSVSARKAQENGFSFQYDTIDKAVQEILSHKK